LSDYISKLKKNVIIIKIKIFKLQTNIVLMPIGSFF